MAEQNRHVTQSNVKIDTEVAGLKTMLESHKLDSIKYLAGNRSELFACTVLTCSSNNGNGDGQWKQDKNIPEYKHFPQIC